MQENLIDVFRQSLNIQEARYYEYSSDQENIQRVLDWYRKALNTMREEGLSSACFRRDVLADDPAFSQNGPIENLPQKLMSDLLYFSFVFEEAEKAIQFFAPSLVSLMRNARKRVVLLRSRFPTGCELIDLRSIHIRNVFGIVVQKGSFREYFDSSHAFRIMAMGHELFHCLMHLLFEIRGDEPGFAERVETDKLTQSERTFLNKRKPGCLAYVLLEAISIAFEYEFIQRVDHYETDTSLIEKMRDSGVNRAAEIKEFGLNMLNTSSSNRKKHGGYVDFSHNKSLAYVEGVRLAKRLRKKGWTLNDLLQLSESMKHIVAENGHYDSERLYQIGISRDPNSEYQRIIRQILDIPKFE